MQVKILGSGAGGGFPQWNCACPNCRGLRAGTFNGKARSQAQVAISGDLHSWFLLGASPDLRGQIEATPDLHPMTNLGQADGGYTGRDSKALVNQVRGEQSKGDIRHSPIAGAVLLNADVDHVLGLLLLRELQPLRVHATKSIRRILTKDNSMFAMLQRVRNQAAWIEFTPGIQFPLLNPAGEDSGLRCRTLPLGSHFPAYVSPPRRSQLAPAEASLGLVVELPSGRRLAYMPAVPRIDESLLKELDVCDVLLFDGTFWSDDELIRVQGSGQTAEQMGHVPVSSAAGSLAKLARLRRPRKIYIHVNNTNPMLNEAGPEYRQVRDSGWEIAEDGWQFEM
jgi:pyrroloquinoline quinone biosynthesis protein B